MSSRKKADGPNYLPNTEIRPEGFPALLQMVLSRFAFEVFNHLHASINFQRLSSQ